MLARTGADPIVRFPGRTLGGAVVGLASLPSFATAGLRSMTPGTLAATHAGPFVKQAGLPWGGTRPYFLPEQGGAIRGRTAGSSTAAPAVIVGRGLISGTIAGDSDALGTIVATRAIVGSAAGVGDAVGVLAARGFLRADVRIGAQPSAEDIAQAVWGASRNINLSDGTMGYAVKIMEAVLAGRVVTDPVAGTYTVYDEADAVLVAGDLWQDAAGTFPYAGAGAERRDRLT